MCTPEIGLFFYKNRSFICNWPNLYYQLFLKLLWLELLIDFILLLLTELEADDTRRFLWPNYFSALLLMNEIGGFTVVVTASVEAGSSKTLPLSRFDSWTETL